MANKTVFIKPLQRFELEMKKGNLSPWFLFVFLINSVCRVPYFSISALVICGVLIHSSSSLWLVGSFFVLVVTCYTVPMYIYIKFAFAMRAESKEMNRKHDHYD